MSNDNSLIYVLVSRVFHNDHFRHFGDQKMRFVLIRQRVFLNQPHSMSCISMSNDESLIYVLVT